MKWGVMAGAVPLQTKGTDPLPKYWLCWTVAFATFTPPALGQEDDLLDAPPASEETRESTPDPSEKERAEEDTGADDTGEGDALEEDQPESSDTAGGEPTDDVSETEPLPEGRATDRSGEPLVAVHFRSPQEGLRFYLGPSRPPPDNYDGEVAVELDVSELHELCTAPCARWVYPGQYSLGLAPGKASPRRAQDPLRLTDPTVVTAEYRSYGWLRNIGWVTMGLGMAGGATMIMLAFDSCDGDGLCLQDTPLSWAGAGIFFAGVTGGLFLTMKEDEISFALSPATGLSEPQ